MPFEVLMPPLSQTLDTLVLVEWLKRAGEPVNKGEPLFLVESDKATLEVEAPASGVLAALLVEPGVEVRVKTPIALITAVGETVSGPPRRVFEPLPPARLQRIAASPRARTLAQQEGVDLAAVRATGPEGMIVERDVKAHATAARAPGQAGQPAQPEPARVSPVARRMAAAAGIDVEALAQAQGGRRITRSDVAAEMRAAEETANAGQPLSPIRRTIAERLQAGYHAAIPVTLTREVDATELVELRARILADRADGEPRPTFTDFFALIAAHCLHRHGALNGTYDGELLLHAPEVHLALAVDTPRGLLAPVLRPPDLANLGTIGRRRVELVEAAQAARLTATDLAGGTFTLSNLGPLRVDAFTPVINPPQIAILGTGRIREAAAAYKGQLALRQLLVLSLTFDHRLVDGAPAARFLDEVAEFIEKPHRIWYA
ncbi:MAG: dihydrolipoamide acetyltransferase family protein [Caldilineaceae bacterium]